MKAGCLHLAISVWPTLLGRGAFLQSSTFAFDAHFQVLAGCSQIRVSQPLLHHNDIVVALK